jgi:hypothetical protein
MVSSTCPATSPILSAATDAKAPSARYPQNGLGAARQFQRIERALGDLAAHRLRSLSAGQRLGRFRV